QEAELVKAYAAASIDLAEARRVRAEAYRMEIANSVKTLEAYWERRRIGEAERRKRAYDHLKSKRIRNAKLWERLRDHPDMSREAVISGRALNFLLYRLSGNVLSYDFSLGSDPTQDIPSPLALEPAVVHSLRLRQNAGNGQIQVFRADEGVALDVEWWPYALREAEFHRERIAFEKVRTTAVAQAEDGRLDHKAIQDLHLALLDLEVKFQDRYGKKSRTSDRYGSRMATWQHYKTADRFMQRLSGEIQRLQETGDSSMLDGSLRFDGTNAVQLLTYMSHNGLEFAPAQPGEEEAYFTLFRMMRDVYLTVAETDPGVQMPVEKDDETAKADDAEEDEETER
ncbi:MAG: hypothetical protein ACREIV_09355, partial [Planctomycetaceae bacterium]